MGQSVPLEAVATATGQKRLSNLIEGNSDFEPSTVVRHAGSERLEGSMLILRQLEAHTALLVEDPRSYS